VAEAHYQAWESLDLPDAEVEAIAAGVAARLRETFLAMLVRGSRTVGATPWVLLNQAGRFWARIFQGGSVRLSQRGPKDALLEASGLTMFDGRAFPIAYRGVVRAGVSLFARTLLLRPMPSKKPHSHSVLISWV
jgi:hypothetical protein